MALPDRGPGAATMGEKGVMLFADCGVVPTQPPRN
jgi:hypothetical protein